MNPRGIVRAALYCPAIFLGCYLHWGTRVGLWGVWLFRHQQLRRAA